MHIDGFKIIRFAPFGEQSVDFQASPKPGLAAVHLLAGKNGCGKTRFLALLAAAIGNGQSLAGRLDKDEKPEVRVYAGNMREAWFSERETTFSKAPGTRAKIEIIDPLRLASGYAQSAGGLQTRQRTNPIVHDPSAGLAIRGGQLLADQKIVAMAPVPIGELKDHLVFENTEENDSKILCQSIVNISMQAAMDMMGGRIDTSHPASIKLALEKAISDISGKAFGFQVEPNPEVHLRIQWDGASMTLGQVPDGLRSIIGLIALCAAKLDTIFKDSKKPLEESFILLLDEPETHMHPEWQWHLLPTVQKLFPNAQIFCATHSPFLLASVNYGWIHVMEHTDDGVMFKDAIPCSEGDSFLDAAEDILGIKRWYDPETEKLLAEFDELESNVRDERPELLPKLQKLGALIASRSQGLSNQIGRQLAQLEKQMEPELHATDG